MKALRFVSSLVLICGLLGVGSAVAVAAPGDLDRFFGREGIATLGELPGGGYVLPEAMAIGLNDEIYVLRTQVTCQGGCRTEPAITRQNAQGSPDASFCVGGVSRAFGAISPSGGNRWGSLAVGLDGKIVVASTDHGSLVLARLNPDGSLDGSFGTGGVARTTVPGLLLSRTELAIHADGGVVVGAESGGGYGYGETTVAVAKYTPQGSLDPAFNGGAALITSLGSGLGGLAADGSNTVLAGPLCCAPPDSAIHVARLGPDGAFDQRFGQRGHRFVDDVVRRPQVTSVIALSNHKVLVVGSDGRSGQVFALRLRPNGRLDNTFGNRGVAYMKRGLYAAASAVDDRGRLVVATSSPNSSSYSETARLGLLRRRPNGSPDRTFGGGSLVRLRATYVSAVTAVGMQSGDRIVTLIELGRCERSCPTPKVMLVRYRGGSGGARCKGRRATIVGTRVGERLTGTRRRDVIAALGGNDVVRGRGGNDLICGGRGNDRLIGGKGRDRLAGGPGRDRLRQR